MKLSEAIRKGCAMKPVQVRDTWSDGKCGACVCMAAAIATGLKYDYTDHDELYAHFDKVFIGWRKLFDTAYPIGQMSEWNRMMTREQVADLIEREYESKLPTKDRESDTAYYLRQMREIAELPVRVAV